LLLYAPSALPTKDGEGVSSHALEAERVSSPELSGAAIGAESASRKPSWSRKVASDLHTEGRVLALTRVEG